MTWRGLLLNPWVWALLALAGSTVLVLADPRVEFVPFLLALVGGWLSGVGFVNRAARIRRRSLQLVTLAVGAVVIGGLLWGLVTAGPPLTDGLPEVARAGFVVIQFAAAPAALWICLAFLAGVTGLIGPRPVASASDSAVAVARPEWESGARGGSLLQFPAVPMRMRTLRLLIAVLVAVVGAITAAALFATGDLAARLGPAIVVGAIALVLVLPASLALRAVMQRRTRNCTLEFTRDRVTVQVVAAETLLDTRLGEVDLLRWRCDSDYARVEIRAGAKQVTLLAAQARVPKGTRGGLPPLSRAVRERLTAAGLVESTAARGFTVFRRR